MSTCFEFLPKFGSDTLLLGIILLLPPAHSFMGSADAINDDRAIVDWLFATFGATELVSCSLLWELFSCDGGSGGGGTVPIMRWMDLSIEVNNLPTSFPGAKFVLYPPWKWEAHGRSIWDTSTRERCRLLFQTLEQYLLVSSDALLKR